MEHVSGTTGRMYQTHQMDGMPSPVLAVKCNSMKRKQVGNVAVKIKEPETSHKEFD